MAPKAKMNASDLRCKKRVLDELNEEFKKELAVFTQQVKTKMETISAEVANKSFQKALFVFTRAFGNIRDAEQADMESAEGRLDFDTKLKEMEEKLESQFEDHLREIGKRLEQIEADLLKVGKEQVKFDDKLKQCDKESKRNKKEDPKSKTKRGKHQSPLNEDCSSNKKSKTTSPQQMPTTTTSISSPKFSTSIRSTVQGFGASAATATLNKAPLSLRQTNTFQLQERDNEPLWIKDVKLLSTNLLLVADTGNDCVRLFDIEGQELDSLECQSQPWSLAILTEKAQSCWSVAVALPRDSSIGLMKNNNHTLSMKSVIDTQQDYHTIEAVSATTLAAGYAVDFYGRGVDLIDVSGKVLRSICSGVYPCCMVTTEVQCLIVLDSKETFHKFNLQEGTQDIKRVSEIGRPECIACLQSGSLVVADQVTQVLHLVRDDGRYKRILWKLPRCEDDDDDDELRCVTINNNVGVCCTGRGSVYVFNVQGDQIQ